MTKSKTQLGNLENLQYMINNNYFVIKDHFKATKITKDYRPSTDGKILGRHLTLYGVETEVIYFTSNINALLLDNAHSIPGNTIIIGPHKEDNKLLAVKGCDRYRFLDATDRTEWEIGDFRTTSYSNKHNPVQDPDYASFLKGNLVIQAMKYGRKKGAIKSNQNSAAQSKRGQNSRNSGYSVTIEFDNPNGYLKEEKKSMMDAYKICKSRGYSGNYMYFYKELKKNGTITVDAITSKKVCSKNGRLLDKQLPFQIIVSLKLASRVEMQPALMEDYSKKTVKKSDSNSCISYTILH